MHLKNITRDQIIVSQVERADSFIPRLIGLMGRDKLPTDTALWISRCSSIHTFFMKFSIDVIFVDRNLQVKSLHRNVKPWRLVIPPFGSNAVFEMNSGHLENVEVLKGDQLYVGS